MESLMIVLSRFESVVELQQRIVATWIPEMGNLFQNLPSRKFVPLTQSGRGFVLELARIWSWVLSVKLSDLRLDSGKLHRFAVGELSD